MSTFNVSVVEISEVNPHPNADNLELVTILGWQVVTQKYNHRPGDRCVYFAPDTVLPQAVSDRFGVTPYLSKQRVRCTRLRGEPSFGFIVPPDSPDWEVGINVAEHYQATKYEPPRPEFKRTRTLGTKGQQYDDTLPEVDLFPRYTNIENMRHYPTVFEEDEDVVATEKIHGCSSRIGIVDNEWMIGSHKVRRKPPVGQPTDYAGEHRYWYPLSLPSVNEMLQDLSKKHRQVVLYGEIYGDAVQSLSYGERGTLGYRAFDLLVDGRFLDNVDFLVTCERYGVSRVPILDVVPYDLAEIKRLSEGRTVLLRDDPQAHIREGVVVKPVHERTHPKIGRVVLKYVSDTYLLNKNITDYAEI